MFFKKKQEASGFPSKLQGDIEKLQFQRDFFDHEGIHLDLDKIEYNSAQRFVFKLFLNSMWGRLGMNSDRTLFTIINTPEKWFAFSRDDQYEIRFADFSYDNCIQVFYKDNQVIGSIDASVVHAAFVTAYGRLKLYSELEKIQTNVLYFDTDSIIFIKRSGEYCPNLGDYLGEFTSELDADEHIVEFVSAGPKNAYKTNKGKYSLTVKGFRLDSV